MAQRRKKHGPGEVDGFMAFKAAQRLEPKYGNRSATSASEELDDTGHKKIGKRVSHTVLPTKHEIVCYECEYAFQITGRVGSTWCPKCRTELDFSNLEISAPWSDTLKTAGRVSVLEGGSITGGHIIAADIIVAGRISGGNLKATRLLELMAGAEVDQQYISAPDLKVSKGHGVELPGKSDYRNVILEGRLSADLKVSGTLTIEPGGCLEGVLDATHLDLREGGGLLASVKLRAG